MLWTLTDKEKKQSSEAFIRTYLLQPDGFIRTTITDRADEYLSESMGLWMLYLVESDEPKRFKTQVKTLQAEFLTADHLVTWQIIGHKKASANALIDDIRIVQALYTASEKWNKPTYQSLADQMSRSIARYQTIEGILTDFVETSNKEVGTELTLSYIVPQALDLMVERKLLSNDVYLKTQQVLLDAPITENGLFPRSYSTRTSRYTYDADVHMIDQFYTGYHRAVWDGDVTGLMSFTKQVFLDGGHKLYGRYDRTTRKPTVTFESAAVYALASMMFREVGETEFADQLLNRMEQLAVQDKASPYYGGYIDVQTKDTHSFDNLLALLAEQQSEMK
ncbi:hypothetical protein [Sporosarcina sp. A2]|uniref:hypothetical protein n=1 Tax=Sporosarcina sp. A2 TaxID=3393449 RepID=UPI003D7BF56B